jgi:serine protease Do
MKTLSIALAALLSLQTLALAQPADTALPKPVAQAVNSLAHLEYKVYNDLTGDQPRDGLAVCVDGKGIFVTRDILPSVTAKEIKEITLTPPGLDQKPVPARYLGADPWNTLVFLQATGENPFKPVSFGEGSKLQLGQKVYSLGLFGQNMANAPYLGEAVISARLSIPEDMIMVTAGELTSPSSPVLTADGKTVGFVLQQLPLVYEMTTSNQQRAEAGLVGRQTSRFFTPIEELAAALKEVPTDPDKIRRLPWLGILDYMPYTPLGTATAPTTVPAEQPKTGVIIGPIVPGSPAEKATLQRDDVVVALNGKPLESLATPDMVIRRFNTQLLKLPMDQPATLSVLRAGQKLDLKVNPEPMPPRPYEMPRYYNKTLGFGGRDLSIFDKYSGGAMLTERGALVMLVRNQSPAANGNLQPNDLITTVNDKPTPTVDTLDTALKSADPNATLKVTVFRAGRPQQLTIAPK